MTFLCIYSYNSWRLLRKLILSYKRNLAPAFVCWNSIWLLGVFESLEINSWFLEFILYSSAYIYHISVGSSHLRFVLICWLPTFKHATWISYSIHLLYSIIAWYTDSSTRIGSTSWVLLKLFCSHYELLILIIIIRK